MVGLPVGRENLKTNKNDTPVFDVFEVDDENDECVERVR